MTTGFQQQERGAGYGFMKQAASPQHGQQPSKTPLPVRDPRSYKPRPGH